MNSFRLLTLAVFAAATLPRLVQRGMFVDGVTYASIARNLSEGRGSFWSPSYTATIYPQFHEHPPFGFWLQSLWFRVLGDHLFVERAYALAAALGTALLMALIWRRLNGKSVASGSGRRLEREPLKKVCTIRRVCASRRPGVGLRLAAHLFWILVPVVSWAVSATCSKRACRC